MARTRAQIESEIARLQQELEELNNPQLVITRLLKATPGVLVVDKWITGKTLGFKLELDTDLSTITDQIREETGYYIHGFAATGEEDEFRVLFHQL